MAIKIQYSVDSDLVVTGSIASIDADKVKITDSYPFAVGTLEYSFNSLPYQAATLDPSGWQIPLYNYSAGPITLKIRDSNDPGTEYLIYTGVSFSTTDPSTCWLSTTRVIWSKINNFYTIEWFSVGTPSSLKVSVNGSPFQSFTGGNTFSIDLSLLDQEPSNFTLLVNDVCNLGTHAASVLNPGGQTGVFFDVPIMNGVKFVARDDLEPSSDNTRFNEWQLIGFTKNCYYQKYLKSDVIPVQYRTDIDISNHFIDVLDRDNNQVATITPVEVYDQGDFKYFQFLIDCNIITESIFYVRITASGAQTYQSISEPIMTSNDWPQCNKISWTLQRNNFLNATYFNGFEPFVRIESHFGPVRKPQIESKIFRDANNDLRIINTTDKRIIESRLYQLPGYLLEVIQWATGCDTFKINDLRVTIEQGLEVSEYPPRYGRTNAVLLAEVYEID
jgi:hypothetical protein